MNKKKLLILVSFAFVLFLISPLLNNIEAQNTVIIKTTDDVTSVINSNPEGTMFVFEEGIHRIGEPINGKNNNIYSGERGAIISGAKVLTDFLKEGDLWVAVNQSQESEPFPTSIDSGASGTGEFCLPEYPRCNYNEELFINDVRQKHVDSINNIGPNEWYFDYANDKIYFYNDPTNKTVETSVVMNAFNIWDKSNVIIENLTVEKFATKAQRAAIENVGESGIIRFVESRLNHGVGMKVGNNGVMKNNYIHRNGQSGYGGRTNMSGALYEANEIAYNNEAGFELTWEAGGGKIAAMNDVILRNNYSHSNNGTGFWSDINNTNFLYENNISINNTKDGIQHEISFDAVFKDNFLAYNNRNQLYIQVSRNAEAYNNTIITDDVGKGLMVTNSYRGDANWYTNEVYVHDNILYSTTDNVEMSGFSGANPSNPPFDFDSAKDTVLFDLNKYYVNNANSDIWEFGPWSEGNLDFSGFQSKGQELNGQIFTIDVDNVPMPTWDEPVGPYGESGSKTLAENIDQEICIGDFDDSNTVDEADHVLIREKYKTSSNDFDIWGEDEFVDLKDYVFFANQYKNNKFCIN